MAINPISSSGLFSVLRQIDLQSTRIVRSAERLASGLRINRAADDPAGISRAARFLSQIGGVNAAATNAQTGISMVQSAEGGLTEAQDLIDDIKNQAIAIQDATLTSSERLAINDQVQQDWSGIQDIFNTTKFNTQLLLQGGSKTLQTGPDAGQTVTVTLPDVPTILSSLSTQVSSFDTTVTADPTNTAAIQAAGGTLETQANTSSGDVSVEVSAVGAVQNRLQAIVGTLNAMSDATNGALSIIRDADVAAETVALSTAQVRLQAGIAMLVQFNIQAQQVLKLLE